LNPALAESGGPGLGSGRRPVRGRPRLAGGRTVGRTGLPVIARTGSVITS